MLNARSALHVAIVLTAAGCGSYYGKSGFIAQKGVDKAAFDMQCDKSKLDVTELSPTSMGVRGCGKQGRYEFVTHVGWVLYSGDEKEMKQ